MSAHKKNLISVGGCALSGLQGGHGYWATSALPAHGGGARYAPLVDMDQAVDERAVYRIKPKKGTRR